MHHAHLTAVARTFTDHARSGGAQLAIAGLAVTQGGEVGKHLRVSGVRLAAEAARRNRARWHEAETHTAFLAASDFNRCGENAVAGEAHEPRVYAADHGAILERDLRAGLASCVCRERGPVFVCGIQDAIRQFHGDTGLTHHVQRARDAALEHDLGERMFDDETGCAGYARLAVWPQLEARHQRAVA